MAPSAVTPLQRGQTPQLLRDLRSGQALVPELSTLEGQESPAGGELAAIYHMDAVGCLHFRGGQEGVLTGAGEVGADVDMDDVIALVQDGGKEIFEFLRAYRRRFGQGAVLLIVGIEVQSGVAAVVGKGALAALDGQGYGTDLEALQQSGGKVTGAVICDAYGSGHGNVPPMSYITV